MRINFWGVVNGVQAFMPHLVASGEGHIVNISSTNGLISLPMHGVYACSKFAVRALTETLRMELEVDRAPVSATSVHPGYVATEIAKSARLDPKVVARSGLGEETLRADAEAMQQKGVSAAYAARTIVQGVLKNRRRVLVGPDAWTMEVLSRLLGAGYQPLVVWVARRVLRHAAPKPS